MIKEREYSPDYIPHPGLTLAEVLENANMTQSELATRTSRPEKTISEIVNGISAITPETAIQFERVLDVPASFWNNLEKNYQEMKAHQKATELLAEEVDLAENYPYNAMAKLGWVPTTRKVEEKVNNLLKFFAVNSLSLVDSVVNTNYRKYDKEFSRESLQVWLRKGEIDSAGIETKSFNRTNLLRLIPELKTYSTLDPNEFSAILQEKLSENGVALVFTNDLPKTYVCGAARWLSATKAMIQLSLRGKYNDILWFTLYHELCHILNHPKKNRFVDLKDSDNSKLEKEADSFAAEYLIIKDEFEKFVQACDYSDASVKSFAKQQNVHPGIVVGRLQHVGLVGFNQLNHLRVRYELTN